MENSVVVTATFDKKYKIMVDGVWVRSLDWQIACITNFDATGAWPANYKDISDMIRMGSVVDPGESDPPKLGPTIGLTVSEELPYFAGVKFTSVEVSAYAELVGVVGRVPVGGVITTILFSQDLTMETISDTFEKYVIERSKLKAIDKELYTVNQLLRDIA